MGMGYGVWETSVAVNGAYRMEVSISGAPIVAIPSTPPLDDGVFSPCTNGSFRIRFAVRNGESSSWTAGYLRPFDFLDGSVLQDPCVVPGPGASKFLIVAKTGNQIVKCSHDAATGTTTPWIALFTGSQGPVDKPWILRGATNEYYVTFWGGSFGAAPYFCMRSTDGGENFAPASQILVDGVGITGGFCPQPAVQGMGPLHIAHRAGTTIRILEWLNEGLGFDFEFLESAASTDLGVVVRASGLALLPVPCPNPIGLDSKTVPYLVADPSNSNQLYLFHHDVGDPVGGIAGENDDPSDVDVYCVRLNRTGDYWSAAPAVRVPQQPPGGMHPDSPDGSGEFPDQFLPAAAVDRFGRIHLIYYDNHTTCGITSLGQKYDVYYALSVNAGENFSVHNLRSCSQRPALNFDFFDPNSTFGPREYIGIAIDDSDSAWTYVTVSYTGTAHGDTTSIHPSAIFSQTIRVRN